MCRRVNLNDKGYCLKVAHVLKEPLTPKFGRRPHPNQRSDRTPRSGKPCILTHFACPIDPSSPRARPDPATTRPRALQTPKSPSISCELRSTSHQMRFESKVNGHREAGATLSSAPFGRLYRPVLALPSLTPRNRFLPNLGQRRPLRDFTPSQSLIKYPPYFGYEVLLLGTQPETLLSNHFPPRPPPPQHPRKGRLQP